MVRQLIFVSNALLHRERYINPSACRGFIYFRCLQIESRVWKNRSLLYEKATDTYLPMEIDIPKESTLSEGIEDLRIYDHDGKVCFVGCVRGVGNVFKTLIGEVSAGNILKVNYTMSAENNHIKNIVPLVDGERVFFLDVFLGMVYGSDAKEHTKIKGEKRLSGSTQFIKISDHVYGGIVHDQVVMRRRTVTRRYYQHYWMEIDVRDFSVTFVSSPFYIFHLGVEFVSGIESIDSNHVYLYYGVDDKMCYKCVVTLQELRMMQWEAIKENGTCFIINMDRNAERYEQSVGRIKRAGFMNVERFAAVDATRSEDLKREWARHSNCKFGRDPSFIVNKGEQGCNLSHMNCWLHIIEKRLPYAVIFEDDVLFHKDWLAIAKSYFDATPKDFDILFMGSQIQGGSGDMIVSVPVYCTHAYIITLEGARKLYDFMITYSEGMCVIDCMLRAGMCMKEPPFKWYAWNGMLYPDENRGVNPHWVIRNTGLVYQDEACGSDIKQR